MEYSISSNTPIVVASPRTYGDVSRAAHAFLLWDRRTAAKRRAKQQLDQACDMLIWTIQEIQNMRRTLTEEERHILHSSCNDMLEYHDTLNDKA